mgnify:CR=1 FL=1
MDILGHYDTDEEIRELILSEIDARQGNVKLSIVNSLCADENQFLRVLDNMIQNGEVQFDGNFIFK